MKFCVLLTIVLSCFAFYNASTIRSSRSTISTISNKNPCDVYLIVNFLLILHKHGVEEHNLSTNEVTPLGLLSSQIYIQKVNDLSFVWNPRTAKIIFIIQTTQLSSLYTDILMTFTMNSVDWEVLLNELIGVNNIPVSQKTIEIFKYLSQMLATALGVKTPPYALLNLYGLIIIPTSLSGKDCGTTIFSPIGELVNVTDNKLLATEIARCSVIIDAATYSNSKYQFSNCACLLHTCSGYATSPLIGNLNLAESLESAISGLLDIYTIEGIRYILIQVLLEHVAYCDIGEPLSYIFEDQNLVESAHEDETVVHSLNMVEADDKEKCSKAPEIEEVTTVRTFVAEIHNSTLILEAVEETETTTEEVTSKKPRIFVDSSTEADSTSVAPQEEVTTPTSTTLKTDDETTTASTTTDAPPTTTTTTTTATTTTTPSPTTTDNATTTPSPTTTDSATTTSTTTTTTTTKQPEEIPTPVDE